MNQDNGGIIGKVNTPTTSLASGVWSLDSQFDSQAASIWPLAFPNTTIANSCRFNNGSSDYLSRTPASAGNQKTWTWSCWIKRSALPSNTTSMISAGTTTQNNSGIVFTSSHGIQFRDEVSSSKTIDVRTDAIFRDVSAWYNIVVAFDSTQGTEADRVKIYVNGVEQSLSVTTSIGLNETTFINDNVIQKIGGNWSQTGTAYIDGYMAEVVFIDGTALDQNSFGAFNPVSNIWEPIAYTGSYGTNGFRLDFADSSALGNDVSGNDNDFTVNNLTSVDQSTDTCSNNFATFNSIVNAAGGNLTLSEGNLKVTSGDNNWNSAIGTIAVNSGKWYWEVKIINATYNYNHGVFSLDTGDINDTDNPMNQTGYSGFYNTDGGETRIDDTVSTSDFGTFAADDILGFYLNADDNQFTIYKNGSSHVSATNLGNGRTDLVPIAVHYNGGVSEYNFGNSPFSISSGNADANGYGNFEYSPTIGGVNYYALCTKNLAEFGG